MVRIRGPAVFLVPAATLALGACGSRDSGHGPSRSEALDRVVAAERAFAALAADSTVQFAFETFIADDGILFRPGPVPGRRALESEPMPADFALVWEPAFADVSAAGDLGYTTGPWRAGRRGMAPDSLPGAGQYVTLWRSTPDGLRFALDVGTSHAPSDSGSGELRLAEPPHARRAGPPADPQQAQEGLRIAAEDLDAALTDGDPAAYRAFAAADVRVLRDGSGPAFGPDALIAAAPVIAGAWATDGAVVAESDDLGYSWGRLGSGGNAEGDAARYYLRIWRRQADGSWKLALDLVTSPPR